MDLPPAACARGASSEVTFLREGLGLFGPRQALAFGDVDLSEQEPAGDKESDDRQDRTSARSAHRLTRPKTAGPKMPANFSATPKNPKNSPDLSRGIRLANSERLSA